MLLSARVRCGRIGRVIAIAEDKLSVGKMSLPLYGMCFISQLIGLGCPRSTALN